MVGQMGRNVLLSAEIKSLHLGQHEKVAAPTEHRRGRKAEVASTL